MADFHTMQDLIEQAAGMTGSAALTVALVSPALVQMGAEVFTGERWFGREVFRRAFAFTTPTADNSGYSTTKGANIGKILDVRGSAVKLAALTENYPIPSCVFNFANGFGVWADTVTHELMMYSTGANFDNVKFDIIVSYTKP